MKKAIKLIIIYFTFLLLGIFLGTILYSLYLNTLSFVSGNEVKLFSISVFLKSAIHVSYCLVFLICPLICYYRIRHPAGIAQTIAYVILCFVTWFGLFPGVYYSNKLYVKHSKAKSEMIHLSEGYFRPGEEKIYFFTKDFDENKFIATSTGIIIDTSEEGIVTVEDVQDDFRLELNKSASPYKEIQLKKIFEKKGKAIPVNFETLISVAKRSFERGFFSYLNFLSLALVICAIYMLSSFFEWKLLNTTFIFFVTAAILSINSVYYSPAFINIKHKIGDNKFFEMLSGPIDDPVIFVFNNLITLIFVTIFVVRIIVKKHKNKNR